MLILSPLLRLSSLSLSLTLSSTDSLIFLHSARSCASRLLNPFELLQVFVLLAGNVLVLLQFVLPQLAAHGAVLPLALLEHDGPVAHVLAVHLAQSRHHVLGVRERDEAEPARLARLLVADHLGLLEGLVLAEGVRQQVVGDLVAWSCRKKNR